MKRISFFLSCLLLLPNILSSMLDEEQLEISTKSIQLSCEQEHLLRCTGLMYNSTLLEPYKHGCILFKGTFNIAVQINKKLTDEHIAKIVEYFDDKPFKFYCPTTNTSSLPILATRCDNCIQTKIMSLMTAGPCDCTSIVFSKYGRSTKTIRINPSVNTINLLPWATTCLRDNPILCNCENIKFLYIQHATNASADNVHCILSSYSEKHVKKQASLIAVYHNNAEYMVLDFIARPHGSTKFSDLEKHLIRSNVEFARSKLIYSQSGGLATLIPADIADALEESGFSVKKQYICANITPTTQEDDDEVFEVVALKNEEKLEDINNNTEPGYFSWGYWWAPTDTEEK